MNRQITVITVCLLILISQNFYSQTKSNYLRSFSATKSEEYSKNKEAAIKLAKEKGIPVITESEDGNRIELDVLINGIPQFLITENINAAKTTSTDKVWSNGIAGYNLSGLGQILGIWDGGRVRSTHQELTGRVTQKDNPSSYSDHATHVAGTMTATGINANAKGMASEANLDAYDYNNAISELSSAAGNNLKLSNHSYGLIRGWRYNTFSDGRWVWYGDPGVDSTEDYLFGFYGERAQDLDNILYNAPYHIHVKSGGNDRNDYGPTPGETHWAWDSNTNGYALMNTVRDKDGGSDGFQSIGIASSAKNNIVVAAVDDIRNGYTSSNDVVMSSFSSWGPTDDGRIKPDISANGVSLSSSSSSGDFNYTTKSGTSMSAPNTTGSIGLILEHWANLNRGTAIDTVVKSATVKAIIINTAEEAGAAAGPDYSFGWGLLNTFKAVELMTLNKAANNNLIKELNLANGNEFTHAFESNGNESIKVTICWTDLPGVIPAASLNPQDLILINDLDLRIVGPDGTHLPWILDPANRAAPATTGDNFRDNVEQIFIENPVAGNYTVKVFHKGTLQNSSQDFSIVISGSKLDTPGQTIVSSPENGLLNAPHDITFKWNRTNLAQYYHLQISPDSTFTDLFLNDSTVLGLQKDVSDLHELTQFFWRVRAGNNNDYGEWTTVRTFTTGPYLPDIPSLIYPKTFAKDLPLNLEFKWSASERADSYSLQLSETSTFTDTLDEVENIQDTTYFYENLEDGALIYWRIIAKNIMGEVISSAKLFKTILPKPDNFSIQLDEEYTKLSWQDNSENEVKFVIERRETGTNNFSEIGFVPTDIETYTDTSVQNNFDYDYRIYARSNSVSSEYSDTLSILVVGVEDTESEIPTEFSLSQNFPNPFNPSTKIKYSVPMIKGSESTGAVNIVITIFDVLGNRVAKLVDDKQSPGIYEVDFDGHGLSSGIYFYRIIAGDSKNANNFTEVKKMLLLK